MKTFKLLLLSGFVFSTMVFTGCGDDDVPEVEPEEEFITSVFLTFTPIPDGDPITGSALDPDGEGPEDLEVLGAITLNPSTEYILTINLLGLEGEDMTAEIREEDDEHMFFFGFSDALFSSPEGDGNIDNRGDAVTYNDFDANNQPVGLTTRWTTSAGPASGNFRVVLKHQPDIKTETSTSDEGESDIDITWLINVE